VLNKIIQTFNFQTIQRACLIFMLLSVAACSSGVSSSDGVKESATIANVNEEKINVKEFREILEKHKKKYMVDNSDPLESNSFLWLKTNALNEMIKNTLFRQEARKDGISLSEEEIEIVLREAKDGYEEKAFKKHLEIENISPVEWEKDLKNNLLFKKLIDRRVNNKVSVNDEDIKKYFAEHEEEFHKGKQVKALHIMVETEEEALRIKKQLDAKDADFEELAREYSLGPEGAEGGDLGYVQEGHMPPELEEIFKLDKGEVSNIIRTPYGSHIFKVVDKRKDSKMSYDESRKIIHDKLVRERQDEAFREWLLELKEKANIEIKNEILAKIS
jgi:parvulin-like peptidyl-prolyl isomerase